MLHVYNMIMSFLIEDNPYSILNLIHDIVSIKIQLHLQKNKLKRLVAVASHLYVQNTYLCMYVYMRVITV
jgi:hypothetical protein